MHSKLVITGGLVAAAFIAAARSPTTSAGSGYGATSAPASAAPINAPTASPVPPATAGTATELSQTNKILPEPTDFLRNGLPEVSVIRPTLTENAGAVATIKSFTADLHFAGQSPKFFATVMALAEAGDGAERGF